jgi:hypothetical protein
MRARQNHHRQSLKDLKRLVALPDICPWIGDMVLRKSLKITAITGGASIFGACANILGFHGPSFKEAATMTFAVGISLTALGLSLKFSSLFLRKVRGVAEASQLNLLEDVRREKAPEHLGEIWDRVIRYDLRASMVPESSEINLIEELKKSHQQFANEHPNLGLNNDYLKAQILHPLVCFDQPHSKEGFILSAQYILMHPSPRQRALRRFHTAISIYANFLDGAPFHATDMRLMEEGEHDPTLQSIRRKAYTSPYGKKLNPLWFFCFNYREICMRLPQKLWFSLFTKAVSSEVGRAILELNERYDSTEFDALHLLWPGSEDSYWIQQLPGCQQHILELRRRIFTKIFGPQLEGAQRLLDRMLLPNAEIATELRYRFDPDYCQGRLEDQLQHDLKLFHCDDKYLNYHLKQCHLKAIRLDQFCSFMETHCADLNYGPREQQALRLAHHTRSIDVDAKMKNKDIQGFRQQCQKGLALRKSLRHQLLCIRTYQTLTIISIREYRQHLEALIQL